MPGPTEGKTPATVKSANDATGKAFSNASTSQSQNCEKPKPEKPCDIDEITIISDPLERKKEYKFYGMEWVPKEPEKAPRSITFPGKKAINPRTLEVVGDTKSQGPATKIKVKVKVPFVHDPSHAKLEVRSPQCLEVVKWYSGSGEYEFPVYRTSKADTGRAAALFEKLFTLHLDPAVYQIYLETCGVRLSGKPVGSAALEVHVYPLDQYTLKIKIPALGKSSYSQSKQTNFITGTQSESIEQSGKSPFNKGKDDYSSKVEGERTKDGTTSVSGEFVGGGFKTEDKKEVKQYNWGQSSSSSRVVSKHTPEKETSSIVLMKNDKELDVTANLKKILKYLADLNEAIAAIRELIKNFVPQIGWKFEFGASFLEGTIAFACGWKEDTDHTVFFGLAASISIWIFKITLSLSFGISIGPAALRIVGELKDAGLKLEEKWEVLGPKDTLIPVTAKAVGLIPFELRGEAVLELYVATYKKAAGARTGFEAEGGPRLSPVNKFEFHASVKWTGLQAFVLTETPGAGETEDVYHLIDEKELWEGKFEP